MARDISGSLTVDPRIEQCGIKITNLRFELDDSDALGRYDLLIAMRVEGGVWPEGRFRLQEYSRDGLMVDESPLFPTTTLDPEVQHLMRPSFKEPGSNRFELIFEPEEVTPAWPAGPLSDSEWKPVPVQADVADERRLGVVLAGLAAEIRPHFDYANQMMVQVAGQVTSEGELPRGLSAQLVALDREGSVRGTCQVDLSRGPFDVRAFSEMLNVYNHHSVAAVQVRLFCD